MPLLHSHIILSRDAHSRAFFNFQSGTGWFLDQLHTCSPVLEHLFPGLCSHFSGVYPLALGCTLQSCNPCNCPAMRLKKELGVCNRDISNLLDRKYYKSEAKVLEQHPTVYGQGQAGQSSNFCYSVDDEATSYRGSDIRRAPWLPGEQLKECTLPQLFRLATITRANVSCW